MNAWTLEELAAERRRARLLEAERERLTASARTRVRREAVGRSAASLGQLLAARREPVVR